MLDKQVQLAMAKWPNVPDCFGWLGLDARGVWRMRDQATQDQGLLGSKITNATLRGFIDRNYLSDETGRYYFQNGPQRVFVDLQATPYIAHSDPQAGWVLHTGTVLDSCDAVWMTPDGKIILQSGAIVAQIDDRDAIHAMAHLQISGQLASDQQLLDWLENPHHDLRFEFQGQALAVQLTELDTLANLIPFVLKPVPDSGAIPSQSPTD
ncbi:hypothetical protein AAKU67_001339 [Oxalobacteraceae bacterium GrIS 2.11]